MTKPTRKRDLGPVRRMAARLELAAKPAPKPTPAPAPVDRHALYKDFLALSKKRSDVLRRRRRVNREQFAAFLGVFLLMPARLPRDDDEKGWRDFAAQVEAAKEEAANL